jgi:hypothetical protein
MSEQDRLVWVVTAGEYSDYHIEGVFTSRAAAEEYVLGHNEGLERVEEYVLDCLSDWQRGPVYPVAISLDTGHVRPLGERTQFRHRDRVIVEEQGEQLMVASTRSEEHATKVAIEKRQEWLRMRLDG